MADRCSVPGTPEERRKLAHQAATHAYLYAGAVKFQAQSLLAADPPDMPEEIADLRSAARQAQAMLLILALRNLLRAAEMAVHYANKPEGENLGRALSRFKAAMPDLVTARDMLDHFDDYLQGKGRRRDIYDVLFERTAGRYVIHIGPASIDAKIALEESRHLSGNVIATAGQDWGYPVGNEVSTDTLKWDECVADYNEVFSTDWRLSAFSGRGDAGRLPGGRVAA
jgi:hypothetical protein